VVLLPLLRTICEGRNNTLTFYVALLKGDIMKVRIRKFAALLGSVWFLCLATPAYAIAIFSFDVTFDSGMLNGNMYTGFLTTDSAADGTYNPAASFGRTLLSFDITIDGVAFDVMDDPSYNTYPLVGLNSENISSLIASGYVNDGAFLIRLNSTSNGVTYDDDLGFQSGGYISDTRCEEGCTLAPAVPEPTTLILSSIGLAGLGFTRRRMKA
jgi:hypothetical protein